MVWRKRKNAGPTTTTNDEEAALDEQTLNSISFDREGLKVFKSRLEAAIEAIGRRTTRRETAKRESYSNLLTRTKDRLAACIFFESTQQASAEGRSSKRIRTTATADNASESSDDRGSEEPGTAPDVAGLKADDDYYPVEEKADEATDALPILTPSEKAAQMLETFKAELHARLVRAKRRVDQGDASYPDIQTAIEKYGSMQDFQSMLDEAIRNTSVNESDLDAQNVPGETDESRMTDELVTPDNGLLLADIKESSWIPAISESLTEQRVKPIFHALFLPRNFLGNYRSNAEVTAGEVNERPLDFNDDNAMNLDKVVDASGVGAKVIGDDGLGIGGEWTFSPFHTAFAVRVVNTDARMLGEGIECTDLGDIPIIVSAGGETESSVLTRPESRGVVSDAFHQFAKAKNGSESAITGSPGIGKSWTLFYALQQALLYDGATVLFFFQKRGKAVMYLRRNDKMYAWKANREDSANSNLFERRDVLVLLDPREAKKGGADFANGNAKLLFAASNNADHFNGADEKSIGRIQAYLGPPLDEELDVILNHFDNALEKPVIESRRTEVGNLIRYVLTEIQFDLRKEATAEAVTKCRKDQDTFKQIMEEKGMSKGKATIPGTLFTLLPKRPERLSEIGYDGQNVEYRVRVVRTMSEMVRNEVMKLYRTSILTYWDKFPHELSAMGIEVEKLFIQDLTASGGMVVKRYLQSTIKENRTESHLIIESDLIVQKNVRIDEVCAKVLKQQNVVAGLAERCPLIDAAGTGWKVYQVTISPGHRMILDTMQDLCVEFEKSRGVNERMEFYWVVPKERATEWRSKKPFRFTQKKEREKNVIDVNSMLEKYVDFYVLPLTHETPVTCSNYRSKGEQPW